MKKQTEPKVIKCPTFEKAYEVEQELTAKAIFARGIERHISKGKICYAVSTNAFIKFKDALKMYDLYVQGLDLETKCRLYDAMLDASGEQQAKARDNEEGTTWLSEDGKYLVDEDDVAGVRGIDF